MEAGRLDQRITLQRPSIATDKLGASRPASWEDVGRVWATVTSPTSQQRFGSPQPMPVETFTVWIRHREIESTWRIIWQGRPYQITGIAYHGRREAIALTVEAAGVRP